MKAISDAIARGRLAMAGGRSPWGGGNDGEPKGDTGAGAGDGPADGDTPGPAAPPPAQPGPRNPWLPGGNGGGGEPPRRGPNIEDIFRSRPGGPGKPGGGGGGGGPSFPRFPVRADGRSWAPWIVGGISLVWLVLGTTHMVGPKEQGIVTTFGKYSRTIGPGVSLTAPWPVESVSVVDVTSIKRDSIPEGEAEKLMLTSDRNLVDISYLVRWNIKDLKLYSFQLADPDQTVKEVAEAAMRASIAEVPLVEAMGGAGRATIEQNVRNRMQAVLDAYRAGVMIQGVEIKKADPPAKVIDAFQKVTVAQQDAQREVTNAQAWAQQVTAQAQGAAAEFDKVYGQYKLAPEVTRRRMYYETMERVLANNDKVIIAAPGVTTYLPLPQMAGKVAPVTAPGTAPGTAPAGSTQ